MPPKKLTTKSAIAVNESLRKKGELLKALASVDPNLLRISIVDRRDGKRTEFGTEKKNEYNEFAQQLLCRGSYALRDGASYLILFSLVGTDEPMDVALFTYLEEEIDSVHYGVLVLKSEIQGQTTIVHIHENTVNMVVVNDVIGPAATQTKPESKQETVRPEGPRAAVALTRTINKEKKKRLPTKVWSRVIVNKDKT